MPVSNRVFEKYGLQYGVELGEALTLEEATEALSALMEGLSQHPNIEPQALQYKLIAALTGGGE